MKKIKIIMNFALLLMIMALANSCNDCPLQEQDPIYLCQTRIVTMEQFNPNFTITPGTNPGEEIVTLDPDYNISIFEFPINSSSTGSFPNDNRFNGTSQIAVASVPFAENNNVYYAAYMDTYPTNSDLSGDILVKQVNIVPGSNTALLRIFGSISLIDQNYLNEDAQAFCEYVDANKNMIETSFQNFTQANRFGANQAGAQVTRYDSSPIIITNTAGRVVGTLGAADVPTPQQSIIDNLNRLVADKNSIDLPVEQGNVYSYIAKNGKRFVFFVSEIRETTISPNRKRVTIMLYPLDK